MDEVVSQSKPPQRKKDLDTESNKSPPSFAIVPFAGDVHSPSSSQHTDCTHNQEDHLIVDCVRETQNIDHSITESVDVIAIFGSMPEGGVDHFSSTPTFLNSLAHEVFHPLPRKDVQPPYSP